jgi:acetylglutamate synthase
MTRAENKIFLQKAIARLKAEVAGLITGNARDGEIRACKSELAQNENALVWLQNRIDTSL